MLELPQFQRRTQSASFIAIAVLMFFFGALAYWTVFRQDLATNQYNPRVIASFNDPGRGKIADRDGRVLVETLPGAQRVYHDTSLAHVLGFLSARYGTQGVELAFNDYLAGQRSGDWEDALNAEFRRDVTTGLDVQLTIDSDIQSVAAAGLGERAGSVVAIDPRNGDVLAMVSFPRYDPGTIEDNGEALFADESSPTLNRATQGRYPPGSTFKTVTAAAALALRIIDPDDTVTCDGEVVIDGFPITCSNVPQGVGTYPFSDAYAYSVNAIFAEVGVDVGWVGLREVADRFGFGRALPFTLETAPTQLYSEDAILNDVLLASTAFGQGELLATPLQMAVVAAIVANGGVLAEPHLGLRALDNGDPAGPIESPGSARVLEGDTARELTAMMEEVMNLGQAPGAAIPGVRVAGKTGTAETGQGTSHAWYIGFAPVEDPRVAVAVIVEDGGQGSLVAAPIAGAVMQAALAQ